VLDYLYYNPAILIGSNRYYLVVLSTRVAVHIHKYMQHSVSITCLSILYDYR
jgi:hypothetical protein